jgi:hypothetical protein
MRIRTKRTLTVTFGGMLISDGDNQQRKYPAEADQHGSDESEEPRPIDKVLGHGDDIVGDDSRDSVVEVQGEVLGRVCHDL